MYFANGPDGEHGRTFSFSPAWTCQLTDRDDSQIAHGWQIQRLQVGEHAVPREEMDCDY